MIFKSYCYAIFALLVYLVALLVTGFPVLDVVVLTLMGLVASASPLRFGQMYITLFLPVILPAMPGLSPGWVGVVAAIGSIPAVQLKWPLHFFLQARAVTAIPAIVATITYHRFASGFSLDWTSFCALISSYIVYEMTNLALYLLSHLVRYKKVPDKVHIQLFNVFRNSSLPFCIALFTTALYHYDKTHVAFASLLLLFALNKDKFRAMLINEQLYPQIIGAMMKVIENTDSYTKGHSMRVAHYSVLIGKQMRLKPWEVERLKLVATLHDLGKQSVPGEVIRKRTQLTSEEMELIRHHCDAGEEILKDISLFKEEDLRAIREHHEWYDGRGYPNHLKGNEICLWARIIAVADAFDAMTSERPYRETWGVNQALDELIRCSGSQFDGEVVRHLVKAMEGVSIEELTTKLQPAGVA